MRHCAQVPFLRVTAPFSVCLAMIAYVSQEKRVRPAGRLGLFRGGILGRGRLAAENKKIQRGRPRPCEALEKPCRGRMADGPHKGPLPLSASSSFFSELPTT